MKEFWRWLHGSGYRGLRSGSDYSRCRSSTENPSTAIHWTSFDLENNMTWSNNRSFKSKPLNNIQQAQFSIGWRFCPVCGHKLYQKNESCSGSISIKCLKCGNSEFAQFLNSTQTAISVVPSCVYADSRLLRCVTAGSTLYYGLSRSFTCTPPGEWYNFLTSTSPCFTGFETL